MSSLRIAFVLAVALSSGCAAPDRRNADDTSSFTLQAGPQNAGQTGKAFLTARGDETSLVYTITGVPTWVARPVRLLTFVYAGTCAARTEPPAYALNEIVQADLFSRGGVAGPFTMAKTMSATVAVLRAGPYALVVRTSPADGNVDIFCGDMQ